MTHVRARVPLPHTVDPPSDPAGWLPEPQRRVGARQWRVALPFGPWHHDAVVHLGDAWHDEEGTARSISWRSAVHDHDALPYERLVPPAHGEVLVSIHGHVEVRATSEPPAGPLGRLLDLVMRRIAHQAVRQLATEIASALADASTTTMEV